MSSSSVRAAVAATEVTHARPRKAQIQCHYGSCPTPRPGGQKRARTKKAFHVDSDFTPVAAVALSSPQPFQGNDSQGAFEGEDADNAEDAHEGEVTSLRSAVRRARVARGAELLMLAMDLVEEELALRAEQEALAASKTKERNDEE